MSATAVLRHPMAFVPAASAVGEAPAGLQAVPIAPERSVYCASRRHAPASLIASLAIVAGLTGAIAMTQVAAPAAKARPPMLVSMELLPPPPPPAAAPTRPRPAVETPPPAAAAPPPLVRAPQIAAVTTAAIPGPPVSIAVAGPPTAAPVAIVAPPAPPAAPVEGGDLSSRMIQADPPRYPTESRRRREEGTVRLSVLVGLDGRVQDIGIAGTSGSARLDKAALSAVKHWRWAPLLRDGAAVMVRGVVTIPFVLRT